ncbi:hypothetical protein MTO96_029451, partial [Rhipicephalus appendiculatus]
GATHPAIEARSARTYTEHPSQPVPQRHLQQPFTIPSGPFYIFPPHSETAAASNSTERARPPSGAQGLVRLNAATAGPDRTPGARSPAQRNAETASPHPAHSTRGPNQPDAAHRRRVHPVEVSERRRSRWPGSGAPRHRYNHPDPQVREMAKENSALKAQISAQQSQIAELTSYIQSLEAKN